MRVFELGEPTLIDVTHVHAAALRERFDQSIFSEDVAGRRGVADVAANWASTGRRRRTRSRTLMSDDASADRDARVRAALWQSPSGDGRGTLSSCAATSRRRGFDLFVPAGVRRRPSRRLPRPRARWTSAAETAEVDANRSRAPRVRRGHGRGHDSARGRHRGPRDQPDERLLRRPGDHHPRAAPRSGPRGAGGWSG